MSEDKNKKIGKDQAKEAKATKSRLDELVTINKGQSTKTQKMENIASANLKISEALFKIQEKPALLTEARAKGTEKRLSEIQDMLNKSNISSDEVKKLLDEATSLDDQLLNVQEASKKSLETALNKDQTLTGLKLLNSSIKEQTESAKSNLEALDTNKTLKKLEGFMGRNADETTIQLREGYKEATANLKAAIESGDEKAAELARKQLTQIKETAESEEERREARKAAEIQSGLLYRIGDGIEGFGEKLDGMGLAAKGGFLAGIAGLFLMFTDPEKFKKILLNVMKTVEDIFNRIIAFVQGDFTTAFAAFEGDWATLGGLVGGIALIFLPKIISVVGGAFKKIQLLLRAANVFRLFMVGTFIPGMVSGLATIGASMGFAVGSLGAILAPALLIVALLGGLFIGFQKLRESLGPGASIMDTLKVAALYLVDFLAMLVNGITFIPRKIIGLLGPRVAKWLFGDDFDTSALDAISEGLDTGRGARAAAEIRERNEREALEAQMREEEESRLQNNVEVPQLDTGVTMDTLLEEQGNLQLDRNRQTPVNNVSSVNANSDNRQSTTTVINNPMISPAAYALGDLGGR